MSHFPSAGPGGQQRYICVECGKHYTTSYNVRMHRNIHLGKNLYTCKFCNKEFSHKHVWEVNYKINVGEFTLIKLLSFFRRMNESTLGSGHLNVQHAQKILQIEVTTILTRKSASDCNSRHLELLP